MRDEFINDLTEGMVIAKALYTSDGVLIAPAGVTLTDPIIRHLEALDVVVVTVEDELKDPKEEQQRVTKEKILKFQKEYTEVKTKVNDAFDKVLRDKADPEQLRQIIDDSWKICESSPNSYETIGMLSSMQEYSDATYIHSLNVGIIASLIGKWLGWSEEEQRRLHTCGVFHDIGKIQIPSDVLNKPGRLSPTEYEIMKCHTSFGHNLIHKLELEPCVINATLMHHERCDGTGYPNRIKRDQIDKYSRIIAIADVYEAMTANRVYRTSMCPFDVLEIIEKDGFRHFDPEYLSVFMQNIVDSYLHSKVLLSNGEEGEIIFINRQKLTKPLIITETGKLVDLAKETDIKIEKVINM